MLLREMFDPSPAQCAHLVGCQRTGADLVIGSLRDLAGYLAVEQEKERCIIARAGTHTDADFVNGGAELATDTEVRFYLSARGGPGWNCAGPAGVRSLRHRPARVNRGRLLAGAGIRGGAWGGRRRRLRADRTGQWLDGLTNP